MNRIEVKGADRRKVADAIGAIRAERGLTQRQVANRMYGAQSTVAMLESGRSRSSVDTLDAVAAAMGYRIDIIFTEVADE